MSVFDRAREDEERGDLGSARNRLAAHAASTGFDPVTCEQVARLCICMKDPVEAGRWYFLCDSADSEASGAIDRFKASCGRNPQQIRAQLPGHSRMLDFTDMPAASAARLRDLGYRTPPARHMERAKNGLLKVAGAVALMFIVGVFIIGLVTIVGWGRR